MKNVIYKPSDLNFRKSKFYKHCKKWTAKLPFVTRGMEYDLVAEKFEFALSELFNYQLDSDEIYSLIQIDMENIFKEAKQVRDFDTDNKLSVIRCDESRRFLHNSIQMYFDILFDQEFTDVKMIDIPFIDDIRFEILKYIA